MSSNYYVVLKLYVLIGVMFKLNSLSNALFQNNCKGYVMRVTTFNLVCDQGTKFSTEKW